MSFIIEEEFKILVEAIDSWNKMYSLGLKKILEFDRGAAWKGAGNHIIAIMKLPPTKEKSLCRLDFLSADGKKPNYEANRCWNRKILPRLKQSFENRLLNLRDYPLGELDRISMKTLSLFPPNGATANEIKEWHKEYNQKLVTLESRTPEKSAEDYFAEMGIPFDKQYFKSEVRFLGTQDDLEEYVMRFLGDYQFPEEIVLSVASERYEKYFRQKVNWVENGAVHISDGPVVGTITIVRVTDRQSILICKSKNAKCKQIIDNLEKKVLDESLSVESMNFHQSEPNDEREIKAESDLNVLNDFGKFFGGKYGTNRDMTIDEVRKIVNNCRSYMNQGGNAPEFYRQYCKNSGPKSFALETLRSWLKKPKFSSEDTKKST